MNYLAPSYKWDIRYLELAKFISTWSKDPSTKVGAVIVGSMGQILATGYNGFPRDIWDHDDRLNDRQKKYQYTVHAEMNCIYNSTYAGIMLKDSTLYVYGRCICPECSKGIIQSGIRRVVIPSSMFDTPVNGIDWVKDFEEKSLPMLEESGVVVDVRVMKEDEEDSNNGL